MTDLDHNAKKFSQACFIYVLFFYMCFVLLHSLVVFYTKCCDHTVICLYDIYNIYIYIYICVVILC